METKRSEKDTFKNYQHANEKKNDLLSEPLPPHGMQRFDDVQEQVP